MAGINLLSVIANPPAKRDSGFLVSPPVSNLVCSSNLFLIILVWLLRRFPSFCFVLSNLKTKRKYFQVSAPFSRTYWTNNQLINILYPKLEMGENDLSPLVWSGANNLRRMALICSFNLVCSTVLVFNWSVDSEINFSKGPPLLFQSLLSVNKTWAIGFGNVFNSWYVVWLCNDLAFFGLSCGNAANRLWIALFWDGRRWKTVLAA